MAAKLIVIFAACFALAQAGTVRREAPSPLQDLEKHAAEFQKTFSEQLNAFTNSKDTKEFNKALKDGSDTVLQQLNSLASTLQKALNDANGKAKEALEQTKTNLERAAADLRQRNPEVEKQANNLREKLQSAVQTTVQETQKLAKTVGANLEETNKKLAPQIKAAYDDFVKQAEDVQKKLHEAANKQ
ncbi:apolipophorin-3-like [Achroia grisella]|uniref:apolipophorin-3-like n=1 Tax=Achroia grisella TaxID=688607 RepID=UPI0027D25A6E|nr:apolipophorin-3-like [Achroia grisella]